ncbi:MAG TPA: dihydrolipoyllysine-residue succinyltransferase [Terriglobia bacterium]|nr:dihydrolipoyllysine-residue succinyltransferase [Terriglobia bacterium]
MPVELVVPSVGESISEVEIGDWLKSEGEAVEQDEPVVVIETEKASVELPAPTAGTITSMLKHKGEKAAVGDVIGYMEPNGGARKPSPEGTGQRVPEARAEAPKPPAEPVKELNAKAPPVIPASTGRQEQIVPMTPIRRRIAERLVEAQNTAALLTTFNQADMSSVMALRKQNQEAFNARYGVKLGFMSFFVKASIEALKQIPQINAEVRGHDIVYRNYYDIGIAVGGGKGLVVPVLRNADRMSFAEIEKTIADFAQRAQANQVKVDELQGGTFTISNGGIYGSMLSTPIVNPPQSGILGLHAIEDRPIALNGEVVVRPMMYLALTYDHRIVDGREAVTFLKRIKDVIEEPARILLEI